MDQNLNIMSHLGMLVAGTATYKCAGLLRPILRYSSVFGLACLFGLYLYSTPSSVHSKHLLLNFLNMQIAKNQNLTLLDSNIYNFKAFEQSNKSEIKLFRKNFGESRDPNEVIAKYVKIVNAII